jgi:hypothetical protein
MSKEEDSKKLLNGDDELSEEVEELKEVMHDEKKKPNMLNEGS